MQSIAKKDKGKFFAKQNKMSLGKQIDEKIF